MFIISSNFFCLCFTLLIIIVIFSEDFDNFASSQLNEVAKKLKAKKNRKFSYYRLTKNRKNQFYDNFILKQY